MWFPLPAAIDWGAVFAPVTSGLEAAIQNALVGVGSVLAIILVIRASIALSAWALNLLSRVFGG